MSKHATSLQWGIIGLGNIAHHFCKDLQLVANTSISAVASRSTDKAKNFAAQYGVAKYYGDYSELLIDSNVDIVYIATPHHSHAEWSIEAMNAGKHVLCEKPLAVNQSEVKAMIKAAQRNKVFLMEALWSRFNPSVSACINMAKSEYYIGRVNRLYADFNFHREATDDHRLFNMDLAGGALLDVGIYPAFLAYSIFGVPDRILASARFHRTGTDLQTSAIFQYKNATANISCGFDSQSDMQAKIYGTKGQILIEPRWHEAQSYTLQHDLSGRTVNIKHPTIGKGFTYEIEECVRCIAEGKLESKKWSWQNSLELVQILDEIRRQIGLKYPFEY